MPDEFALTPFELMTLHAEALFTTDAWGRIIASNEPEPDRAPLLHISFSDGGAFTQFRDDLPEELVASLERQIAEANQTENLDHDALVARLDALMAAHAPGSRMGRGLVWAFPPTISAPGAATAITPRNLDRLQPHFPYAAEHLAAQAPCFVIENDGIAVSICFSSRNTPDAAAAGVFTIAAARGHGYAPRVVAAWAQAVRAEGRIPLYSADAQNTASRAVARKLGLIEIGRDLSWE